MNFDDVEVRINKPYPEIVDAVDDRQTVSILKNLATSRSGELGGILQYIYQSVVADKVMEDAAKMFEEIGVVEMIHLSLLMHAIQDFGGVPKYEDAQGNIFNTSGINYSMKLKDMLDNNILAEKQAIDEYKRAIEKVKNQSLKSLLSRILEDEELHLAIFKRIRDNVTFFAI